MGPRVMLAAVPVLPRRRMRPPDFHLACLVVLVVAPSVSAANLCEPTPEIERAIGEVLAPLPQDAPLEDRLEALRTLRTRFERDLFVHLRYQDEVFERGIEGQLREMLEEYLLLRAGHEGDAFYLYLAGRAFEGRGTKRAVAMMEQVLAIDPDFAPAHRTLAEIYGSKAFRDPRKERDARRKLAAACPTSVIARRPAPLPPQSTFFTRLRESRLTPEQEAAIPAEEGKRGDTAPRARPRWGGSGSAPPARGGAGERPRAGAACGRSG